MEHISERVVPAATVRALSARHNAPGVFRLAVHVLLLWLTGWGVASAGPVLLLPAMVALGIVQAALFAPAHETMHQTVFTSRRANVICGWIVSCPSLLNAQFYTSFHLAHHRHTQIPGADPELAVPDPDSMGAYLRRVFGVSFWRLRLGVIRDAWRGDMSAYPYIAARDRNRVITSVRVMSVVVFGGALLAGLVFGWQAPLLYWLGPQVLGQPFLRAYLLAEHTGCTQDRNGLTNTRTTLTNSAVRWLMWDMPFHAEHHLYPSVPFHHLAALHAEIQARLGVVQPGYIRWHQALIRRLRAPSPAA